MMVFSCQLQYPILLCFKYTCRPRRWRTSGEKSPSQTSGWSHRAKIRKSPASWLEILILKIQRLNSSSILIMCTRFTELQSATDQRVYCRKIFDHLRDARAGEGEGLLREEDKSQILWSADPHLRQLCNVGDWWLRSWPLLMLWLF